MKFQVQIHIRGADPANPGRLDIVSGETIEGRDGEAILAAFWSAIASVDLSGATPKTSPQPIS